MFKHLLTAFFGLIATCLVAQSPINGTVTDAEGVPLAFVSVLLNDDPARGVLSDIEGRFKIGAEVQVTSLTFRYVGYETLRLAGDRLHTHALRVQLRPALESLPEANILAGENPAERLIRNAVAHRRFNNPEMRSTYRCQTYNKIIMDVRPHRAAYEAYMAKKRRPSKRRKQVETSFENAEAKMAAQHAFLMESVTERSFRAPNLVQEKVLRNRVSGLQNSGIVALANAVQPFSFYGDYLRILDKNFVNPISPGSTKLYFFNIEDTLSAGTDTIWVISFHPRQGRVFEGLEGVLHLHSQGWAIQNVRATQAGRNGNLQLKIEQAYLQIPMQGQPDSLQWFPQQLNFELWFDRYPSPMLGISATGRSYIDAVELSPPLQNSDFDPEMPLSILPNANTRADSAWAHWRTIAPLNAKELRTYRFIDSIGDARKIDRWMLLMDYLATGRAPLRHGLSLDLNRFIRLNDFEGIRLGAGLTTAQARPLMKPKKIEGNVYAGYGLQDQQWKYGAGLLWRIRRGSQTQLRLDRQYDLQEPGALYELQPAAFVNRTLYARRMDYNDLWMAAFSTRIGQALTAQLALRRQDIRPAYPYLYTRRDGDSTARFVFQEATAYFRFAYGEQWRNVLGARIDALQRLPVLELGYTRGWGNFQYHRMALALYQSVLIRRLGRADWRIEAGLVSPDAPYAKLFSLNQTGGGFGAFAVRNTFQSLPDTLFLADRFVNLYYAQELGHIGYRTKYSAPYLTLIQNMSWSHLAQPEHHALLGFTSLTQPLYESGIRLDDLLRINYVNFAHIGIGTAFFYRWGALQSTDWRKNSTWRLALRMQL